MLPGTLLTGESFLLPTESDCSTLCHINSNCTFYVWQKMEKRCLLESYLPSAAILAPGVSSGSPAVADRRMEGVLLVARMVHLEEGDIRGCKDKCNLQQACTGWTWIQEWGENRDLCVLHGRSDGFKMVAQPGLISG